MTSIVINPTPGRVVWYYPQPISSDERDMALPPVGRPLAAIVAYVHSDRMVNLMVIDINGETHSRRTVRLLQEGDVMVELGTYATFMPRQLDQARTTL